MQFPQQASALRRMEAINKLLSPARRIEGLYRLFLRVCAEVTPQNQRGHRKQWGRLTRERHRGFRLVVQESGFERPPTGSQGEDGPQDTPQAGQHLGGEDDRGSGYDSGNCRVMEQAPLVGYHTYNSQFRSGHMKNTSRVI